MVFENFVHVLDFDGTFSYPAKLIRDNGFGEDIITTIQFDLLSRKSNRSILRAINTLQAQNTFSSEIKKKYVRIFTYLEDIDSSDLETQRAIQALDKKDLANLIHDLFFSLYLKPNILNFTKVVPAELCPSDDPIHFMTMISGSNRISLGMDKLGLNNPDPDGTRKKYGCNILSLEAFLDMQTQTQIPFDLTTIVDIFKALSQGKGFSDWEPMALKNDDYCKYVDKSKFFLWIAIIQYFHHVKPGENCHLVVVDDLFFDPEDLINTPLWIDSYTALLLPKGSSISFYKLNIFEIEDLFIGKINAFMLMDHERARKDTQSFICRNILKDTRVCELKGTIEGKGEVLSLQALCKLCENEFKPTPGASKQAYLHHIKKIVTDVLSLDKIVKQSISDCARDFVKNILTDSVYKFDQGSCMAAMAFAKSSTCASKGVSKKMSP